MSLLLACFLDAGLHVSKKRQPLLAIVAANSAANEGFSMRWRKSAVVYLLPANSAYPRDAHIFWRERLG
jgi:hypothetical protein